MLPWTKEIFENEANAGVGRGTGIFIEGGTAARWRSGVVVSICHSSFGGSNQEARKDMIALPAVSETANRSTFTRTFSARLEVLCVV